MVFLQLDPCCSFWESLSLKRSVKTFPAVMTSVFSSAMQMLSVPGDFPVFICFIAWVTSCSGDSSGYVQVIIRCWWVSSNGRCFSFEN